MIKKKLLAFVAVSSLIAVGAGVATVSYDGTQVLAIENGESARSPIKLGIDQTSIVTPGGKTVNYEYLDNTFVMKDDVQKISSVTIETSKAATGEYFIQLGYKSFDELHPYYYTDKVLIPNILEPVTFAEGKEPSVVKVYGADLSSVTLGYKCENLNENNYNEYPMVEAGWYMIGKGSFLNPLRPKKFSPISGIKMNDTDGVISLTHEFKKGDEICFYNPTVAENSGYYGITSSDTYDEYYVRTENNVVFNKDVNVTLSLNSGHLSIDKVGDLTYTISLMDTSNSGTKFDAIYFKGTLNNWGATPMPFVYENGVYVLKDLTINPNEPISFKINLSETDWSGKQVYCEGGEGGNFKVDLPWENSNIQICFDFSVLVKQGEHEADNAAGTINILPL